MIWSLALDDLNDASSFDEEVMEYKEKVKHDPQQVMLNLENYIDELKDHGMDLLVDEETPM